MDSNTPIFDWRFTDSLTPVRNQVHTDLCWAFSICSSIDAVYNMYVRKMGEEKIITSPQFLYDGICQPKYTPDIIPNAPNSGYPFSLTQAFTWIKENGIELEELRPFQQGYVGIHQRATRPKITIKDFEYYTTLEAYQLKELIKVQPVVATMFITDEFLNLKNTIYEGPEEKDLVRSPPRSNVPDPNQNPRNYHFILVVGFGEEDDEDYFIIQNSWGTNWGEEGFGKVRLKIETSTGPEYLLKHFAFPIL